jgi:hypothetical protein
MLPASAPNTNTKSLHDAHLLLVAVLVLIHQQERPQVLLLLQDAAVAAQAAATGTSALLCAGWLPLAWMLQCPANNQV